MKITAPFLLIQLRKGISEGLALIVISLLAGSIYYLLGPGYLPFINTAGPSGRDSNLTNVQELSLEEAYTLYQRNAVVFIDARDPWSYEQGHLPGAINMTGDQIDSLLPLIKTISAADKKVVTYCAGKACNLALELAQTLKKEGVQGAAFLVDGWGRWQAKGYPLERKKQ